MEFTTLCSGSSGNCLYIAAGRTRLLVDAGCSCRYLERSLALLQVCPHDITALVITHEHSDHISGVARISRRFGIPVFASELTWENLPFRQDFAAGERHLCGDELELGELGLQFFPLSHDAAQPVGLTARSYDQQGEHCLGVLTDTGCVTPQILRALYGAQALVLEANHSRELLSSGPYPAYLKRRIASEQGHLSNEQAAELLLQLGGQTSAVLLAHLSDKNNSPHIAIAEFSARLTAEAAQPESRISIAPRREPHPLITVI